MSADPANEPTDQSPAAAGETSASPTPAASPAPATPPAPTGSKIAIGSQRQAPGATNAPARPAAVDAAKSNPVQLRDGDGGAPADTAPPAVVNSSDGLSDDVDAEIEAMMSAVSMDSVLETSQAVSQDLEIGGRVKGTVSKIHNDNVFVKLPGQYDGVATFHHFKEEPAIGSEIELIVRGRSKEDGLYELGVPGVAVSVGDWDEIEEGSVVDVKVTGSNTGGLEVMLNSLRGFMPASQIDRFRVEDLESFKDQKLQAVVMEVNADKRKLVVSRRAILERENEEKRKQLLEELAEGQVRDGVITKLMDFGAFCDLGGVEGLIHVSKVSWNHVKHPSEVLEVGQNVSVVVEKIGDAGRISLSHRDTMEHPWKKVDEEFRVDEVVKGTVTRVADFGAFVRVGMGIEGLVHISELAHHRVSRVSNVVNEGDEIQVKILSIDPESQKMGLSLKATQAAPAPKGKPGDGKPGMADVEELPARDLAVPSTGQPLKGGTGGDSGGESIGLNW